MHQPKLFATGLLASTLALVACSDGIDPLQIPAAGTVSLIEGTISNSYDISTETYRDSVTITDPAHIQRIVALLETLNTDMVLPFGTFPTPTHAIVFKDSSGLDLVIFVGLDWVGGRNCGNGCSEKRLRSITDEQRDQLLRAVGLKDYRFGRP